MDSPALPFALGGHGRSPRWAASLPWVFSFLTYPRGRAGASDMNYQAPKLSLTTVRPIVHTIEA